MIRPEVVSPAGTLEKGLTALRYGADAVYCGLQGLSMRSRAGNLDPGELQILARTAHDDGRRVYLATNIFLRDADLPDLRQALDAAREAQVDALIVSDPAALLLARECAPEIPLHLSTQANTLNTVSAGFWFSQGVRRIVLARELSLQEVAEVTAAHPGRSFEVFAHGALCMAYSGRCFISPYLARRDSNRGDCAQGCRWSYRVEEAKRPGEWFEVEEEPGYTEIFFSRDLCTLPLLPGLVAAGVAALKIEGRMKSLYYAAVVSRIYREALDRLAEGPESFDSALRGLMAELERLPNRGYTSHFLGGDPSHEPPGQPPDAVEERESFIGLLGRPGPEGFPMLVRNGFRRDEPLELLLPRGTRPVHVKAMRNTAGEPVETGASGVTIQLELEEAASEGLILRRRLAG